MRWYIIITDEIQGIFKQQWIVGDAGKEKENGIFTGYLTSMLWVSTVT